MDRTWTLHWLQAAGTLAPWRPRIRTEMDLAFRACARLVRPPRVDVVIHQIRHWPTPELGFGGSSPSATTLFLAFDTDHPALETHLHGGLRRVVLHEVHHCLRQAGPGYGTTLGEALVSEGLADHFVVEALGGAPDPWCTALNEAELERVAAQAEPVLNEEGYDHPAWFLGGRGRMQLPRWSGHSLGWTIVDRYLAATPGARASALAGIPAERILHAAPEPHPHDWPATAYPSQAAEIAGAARPAGP